MRFGRRLFRKFALLVRREWRDMLRPPETRDEIWHWSIR
jgi:hypothetical protein